MVELISTSETPIKFKVIRNSQEKTINFNLKYNPKEIIGIMMNPNNGEILATHSSYFEIEPRTYTLKYSNGKIEMYKGGELIISVDKEIKLSSSDIELYSNEGERFCIISDLKLVEIE